jgi:hypothetical protein
MLSAPYLSTHLCFFPYMSTLVRGHGPHYTWLFFFGDSNRPTLFICYPGSIEKLTLLGAIYFIVLLLLR